MTTEAKPKLSMKERLAKRGLVPMSVGAEEVGVSRATVYRWVDDALVDGEQVAGQRYVNLKSLREYAGCIDG